MCPQFILFIIIIFAFLISGLLYLVRFISSIKIKNQNKISSFECGFIAIGSLTSGFRIHFFIFLLIFVLFELEVILLIGCLFAIRSYSIMFLILFILFGIYLEWYLGKLRWII